MDEEKYSEAHRYPVSLTLHPPFAVPADIIVPPSAANAADVANTASITHIPHNPDTDTLLRELGAFADAQNVQLYVVGGYVRDALRAQVGGCVTRKDVDFTVVGNAVGFARELARKVRSTAVVYERFGTAMVPVGGFQCEFVGTRLEEYLPNSRKPVVSEGTLEDDLRRRDFTVNALAASINTHFGSDSNEFGKIIDLFGGREDIDRKLLRTPLDARITFNDDPLRMLRMARFAAQLDFRVDENALQAARQLAERICIISRERVSDELLKLLAAPRPSIGFKLLFSAGLLKHIFPEVHALAGIDLAHEQGEGGQQVYRHKDVFLHTLQVVDNLSALELERAQVEKKHAEHDEHAEHDAISGDAPVPNAPSPPSKSNVPNVWLRFAGLMHDIAKPKTKRLLPGVGWSFHGHEEVGARWQGKIFRRMKLPLQHLPYVETLVRLHQRPMVLVEDEVTDSAIRRLVVQADDALEDLFLLCRADITTKNPGLMQRYVANYDRVYQKVLDVRERDELRAFQSPVRGEEIMAICGIEPSRTVGFIKAAIEEAILDGIIPNTHNAAMAYFLVHKHQWLAEAETQQAQWKQNAHTKADSKASAKR
jgi:poly(A) polymerase